MPRLYPSGYFEFFDIPPGRYLFEVEPPRGFAASTPFSGGIRELGTIDGPTGIFHRIELSVNSDKHSGMDLYLYRLADRQ